MKLIKPRFLLLLFFLFAIFPRESWVFAQAVRAKRGMVASVNPIATQVGLDTMKSGGNAVDAAVATALTLGIVDGHNSGLGGGCFVLVRSADGSFLAIDGRETAPAAATRDMFVRDGMVIPGLSTTGPLAIGVPGALAAYDTAIAKRGKLKLADLLISASKHGDDGFPVDRVYARNLNNSQPALAQFPGSREMLLKADATPYAEGETLKLPDLARSYRVMAKEGRDWFYEGKFANDVDRWMKANGGLITKADFENYRAIQREPIITEYRGHKVVGFPPPSSGGIHVAQILNILENFDMAMLLREKPATAIHVIGEAMKLAVADRAHWLGDADFAKVPKGLVNEEYARQLAKLIELNSVADIASHGLPPNWESDLYGKHTTHIAAADELGNWVAITATVNTSFGSKVVVPGTGLVLNNEMDDFSSMPGVPNAFGLVGAEANAVEPGKRPLSSMSPTIVVKDDIPVLTVGAAGGPKIITQVVLAIVRFIDGGMGADDSISRPRLHHQWRPDKLFVEQGFDERHVDFLKSLGHEVEYLTSGGVAQMICRGPNGVFLGVADPRVPGKAIGF